MRTKYNNNNNNNNNVMFSWAIQRLCSHEFSSLQLNYNGLGPEIWGSCLVRVTSKWTNRK